MTILNFAGTDIPDWDLKITSNFGNTLPNYERIPGLSGAIRVDGRAGASRDKGRVDIDFMLQHDSKSAMIDEKQKLVALCDKGLGRLTLKHSDSESYFCEAEMVSFNMSEELSNDAYYWQSASASFIVPQPVWYENNRYIIRMDDNHDMSDGLEVGADDDANLSRLRLRARTTPSTGSYSSTTKTVTYTITNNGTAQTPLLMGIVSSNSSNISESVTIRRVVNGLTGDLLIFDRFPNRNRSEEFNIDGQRLLALMGAEDALLSGLEYKHPRLFVLLPGANTVEVSPITGSRKIDIYHWWLDAYR